MALKRRRFDIFSMSFLDTICCAFGSIVLLYMILNAATGRASQRSTAAMRADADKLEIEVLEGYENMVAMTNALKSADRDERNAQGQASRILEELDESKVQLAEYNKETLARREHINQLKADLKSLEEGTRRLEAGSTARGPAGNRTTGFRGEGDREYLTGIKLGGSHTLILLDASASMLDETIVNVLRMRNMGVASQRAAPKWRSAVSTVEWLVSQVKPNTQLQIYAFNTKPWPLKEGSEGKWLSISDAKSVGAELEALHALAPSNGTSLDNVFDVVNSFDPKPDSVVLITDGLPTQDRNGPGRSKTIDSKGRLRLFERAIARYPRGIPLNVILFPMEGDPEASGAFWVAARQTRGSYMVPSKDWP